MRKAAGLNTDAVSCGRRNLANEMPRRDRQFGRADCTDEEVDSVRLCSPSNKITGSVSPNAACSLQARGNVGILEDIEHPMVRENVVTRELVVGRDVEEQVGGSLAAV